MSAAVEQPKGLRILGFTFNHATNCIFLLQTAMVILYGTVTKFDTGLGSDATSSGAFDASSILWLLTFVVPGLAYLTITSARYSWSSLAFTLFLIATAIQWGLLLNGFWDQGQYTRNTKKEGWTPIPLNANALMNAIYIAATVIISYGAVAGRLSFLQSFAMVFFEIFFATANFKIAQEGRINDYGGTMYIHIFGATFGLVVSWLNRNKPTSSVATEVRNRTRVTGTFGLLGTLLLFVTYPIFNSAAIGFFSGNNGSTMYGSVLGALSFRAAFNTIFAVSSSVAGAFLASKAINGGSKFCINHVQGAMIAGGAAISATAPMLVNPWGAMLTGVIVGFFSVVATAHITPFLEKFGLYDASNVLGNHLLAGIVGSIASAIAVARVRTDNDWSAQQVDALVFDGRTSLKQGGYQMAFGVITFVFAIIGALLTGVLLNLSIYEPKTTTTVDDMEEWVVTESGAAPEAVPTKTVAAEEGAAAPAPAVDAPAAAPRDVEAAH